MTLTPTVGPTLHLDVGKALANLQRLRGWMPSTDVWYSIKANPAVPLLRVLAKHGAGFHVSSSRELQVTSDLMRSAGAHGLIVCSDPVNSPSLIATAATNGVRTFGCDSIHEVEKLEAIAGECEVFVRLDVGAAPGALATASSGVTLGELPSLLNRLRRGPVRLRGYTFHVGSNASDIGSWLAAIDCAATAMTVAERVGVRPEWLNLGGGIPASPAAAERVCQAVMEGLTKARLIDLHRAVEPGRFLVATAGSISTHVIGKAVRKGRLHVYVDLSVYNGLHEASEGIRYELSPSREGVFVDCTVHGSTCSGLDVIALNASIPEPELGDVIRVEAAGAYSSSAVTTFCSLPELATLYYGELPGGDGGDRPIGREVSKGAE